MNNDTLALALEQAAKIMAGTVTCAGSERMLARALIKTLTLTEAEAVNFPTAKAVKLTVQQRLGFEITLARARIERAYKRMQDDLHAYGKYPDTTMIELHEAEQILTALERVSGDFYRRHLENMKAYREEQKQQAKADADTVLAVARERT